MDSFELLKNLHQDLIALSQIRLASIERLGAELDVSIPIFRQLLDKPPKNDAHRQSLNSGKFQLNDVEVEVDESFKQLALEVADALDLDELEAAKLVSTVLDTPESHFQSHIYASVSLFHEQRLLIVRSLYVILQQASNNEATEEYRNILAEEVVPQILDTKNGPDANGSQFARKCLTSMGAIEKWLQHLVDQSQKASVLGQAQSFELLQLIEVQRSMLLQQHEILGGCLSYLFQRPHTISEDLRKVFEAAKRRERLDILLIHYLPALISGFHQYGSLEGAGTLNEARSLHQFITRSENRQNDDSLLPFRAALTLLWTAYYSSWYREISNAHELQRVNLEQESQERSQIIQKALDDGALETLLAICAVVSADEWRDPARQELVHHLLSGSASIIQEEDEPSGDFQLLLMERLESFSESWISNMPDAIRRLKSMEDDERLRMITSAQNALESDQEQEVSEAKLHLECFLVLISYAFEHRPEAADGFWGDSDSNLYGFLQWSSKRQTVPRVSAFCEMLCAISEGPEASIKAHEFLLEETQVSNRNRRLPSLNYSQMFAELELYSNKVHENPTSQRTLTQGGIVGGANLNEVESPVMLACYLRLITHMCKQCVIAREFIFYHKTFNLVTILLKLSYGSIPSYLRASVFKTLQALLTDHSINNGNEMWNCIDQWSSGEIPASISAAAAVQNPKQRERSVSLYLEQLASSLDQGNACIALLQALITPATDAGDEILLPFPENLGSTYRMPGIKPYVDFVVLEFFTKRLHETQDEPTQLLYRFNCLAFIATCLETFDERVILSIAEPKQYRTAIPSSKAVLTYAQRHPFSRVMELLHDVDVFKMLLSCTKASVDLIQRSPADSLLLATLQRSIDILNKALDLQPDYNDVVRPILKIYPSSEKSTQIISSFSSFEEALINFSSHMGDLRLYAASSHPELTKKSLNLLSRLSKSRKLNVTSDSRDGRQKRKPIAILDPQTTSEETTISFVSKMQVDILELEQGPQSAAYSMKESIVDFLNSCLEGSSGAPSIAHPLLGFSVVGDSLAIGPNGLIDSGISPLHKLLDLVRDYPDGEEGDFQFWMLHLKRGSFQVLRSLWTSPVSAALTLSEMRKAYFLSSTMSQQHTINSGTLWSGMTCGTIEFWFGESADTLAQFLGFRSLLCEYALSELRSVTQAGLSATTVEVVSELMGQSAVLSGQTMSHISLFDLFDIANIDCGPPFEPPAAKVIPTSRIEPCLYQTDELSMPLYDLDIVQEVLRSSLASFRPSSEKPPPSELEKATSEANELYEYAAALNRLNITISSRRHAIRSWVELVIVVLASYSTKGSSKAQFALQLLQLVLTKLEGFIAETWEEAFDLVRLADELTIYLTEVSPTQSHQRISSMINERMHHLFQVCVSGICIPDSPSRLRELMYSACTRYLTRINSAPDLARLRHSSLDLIKNAGSRLMTTSCSDADTADDACKLAATLFLTTLVTLGQSEKSQLILHSFIHGNFLDVLIEPIKTITDDVQEIQPNEVPAMLVQFEARLSLLLQISKSRSGANQVLEAGLFQAVSDSGLFVIDTDVGLEYDDPTAVKRYHELVASILRLLVATLVTQGAQNEQSRLRILRFLKDHRSNAVGMFKRQASIGSKSGQGMEEELASIIRSYSVLMMMTDFLEFEENQTLSGKPRRAFT